VALARVVLAEVVVLVAFDAFEAFKLPEEALEALDDALAVTLRSLPVMLAPEVSLLVVSVV
jgi:hypothetical protein